MKKQHVETLRKSLHFTSRVLFLKGIVAGSVTALAVFGVATPYIGPFLHIAPHSAVAHGIVATVGGLVGAALAAKAS